MSKKIGALWAKQTKDGKVYLSGVLEDLAGDIRIAVFQNDRKQKDNEPDYQIVRSDPPKEQKNTVQAGDFLSPKKNNGEAPMNQDIEPDSGEIKVEDIPF